MKKSLLILAASLALSTGMVQAKDWTSVKVAVDAPYEPFAWKLPNGEYTGFEIELGNAVCEEIKLKCEWITQAWDGIIPGLLARKYDVIFSSMSIKPDRAKKVTFTKPYYATPSAWFAKKGSKHNLADQAGLKGVRIGVQRNSNQETYVREFYSNVEIVTYETTDTLALDLDGGRLDLVFLDYPVGEKTILTNPNFETVGETIRQPETIFGLGVGAAFRPRDKELVEMFDKGLDTVKFNGTYDRIMKKYFAYNIKL